MPEHETESVHLAMIREAHAAQTYEYPTKQTYCPASDVQTDECHTCIVLAHADRLAEQRERLADDFLTDWGQEVGRDNAAGIEDWLRTPPAQRLRAPVAGGVTQHLHGDWLIDNGKCPFDECEMRSSPVQSGGGS